MRTVLVCFSNQSGRPLLFRSLGAVCLVEYYINIVRPSRSLHFYEPTGNLIALINVLKVAG
jgi:hypothetical protein